MEKPSNTATRSKSNWTPRSAPAKPSTNAGSPVTPRRRQLRQESAEARPARAKDRRARKGMRQRRKIITRLENEVMGKASRMSLERIWQPRLVDEMLEMTEELRIKERRMIIIVSKPGLQAGSLEQITAHAIRQGAARDTAHLKSLVRGIAILQ